MTTTKFQNNITPMLTKAWVILYTLMLHDGHAAIINRSCPASSSSSTACLLNRHTIIGPSPNVEFTICHYQSTVSYRIELEFQWTNSNNIQRTTNDRSLSKKSFVIPPHTCDTTTTCHQSCTVSYPLEDPMALSLVDQGQVNVLGSLSVPLVSGQDNHRHNETSARTRDSIGHQDIVSDDSENELLVSREDTQSQGSRKSMTGLIMLLLIGFAAVIGLLVENWYRKSRTTAAPVDTRLSFSRYPVVQV